jgi:glycine betaine/proline transport system permease protein
MALVSASTTAPTFRTAPQRRWLVPAAVVGALAVAAIALGPDVPSWLDIGLQKWVRDRYLWSVQNSQSHWLFTRVCNPLSDAINWSVERMIDLLQGLRWPGVMALVGAIGWRTGGPRAALTGVAAFAGVAVLGQWDLGMITLSLMLVSVIIALLIGVPLGIWTARSDRAQSALRPLLDAAQVMPAFVYLIPVEVFFGIKYPPAVVATVIYAVAPAVRLTNLGIRQVPVVLNEVGESFGCTPRQQLLKVQLPMARRTILLGLNQVIMMAFGVVVIASLLGAGELGNQVLKGLQKNDVGAAFAPGLAIVLFAVGLDRISTAERAHRTRPSLVRLPSVSPRTSMWISFGTIAAAAVAARVLSANSFPSSLTIDITGSVNDAVGWVQDHIRSGVPVIGGTQSVNDWLVTSVLEPLRSLLVWLPWLLVVLLVAAIAYASKGWQLALGSAGCLLAIGAMGDIPGGADGRTQMWDLAMDTLSQVLVAIIISIVIALPLGLWAGRSDRVNAILRPFLDAAQVMPQFVYLIPVVFLFLPGRGAGVVACVIYAVPPCIRLTALGLREVSFVPREAAISFGATPRQELVKVQLPLAFRAIMLGINQTLLMVLATVIIASLIGAGALGLVAYGGFAKPIQKIGEAAAGGLSIVFLAIVLDRITQAWGQGKDRPRNS